MSTAILPIIVTLVLPIVYFIYLIIKERSYTKCFIVGFLTFFIFQLLIRIPLLQVSSTQPWFITLTSNMWLYALFLGVSAAIFEEIGRLIMMKGLFKPKHLNLKSALIFGIGHWSCEAIMLVGINYLIYAISSPLMLPAFELSAIATLERLFVLPIHIAMSVMVMKSIISKKPFNLVLALIIHTIIDALLLPMQVYGFSIMQIESYIFIWFVALSYYLFKEIKGERENEKIV